MPVFERRENSDLLVQKEGERQRKGERERLTEDLLICENARERFQILGMVRSPVCLLPNFALVSTTGL